VPLSKHKEAQYLAILGQKSIREFSLQYVYNNSMQQILVESLIVPSYSRNSPHFIKTDGELPCSLEFATCSCLEPAQSSSRSPISFAVVLITSYLLRQGFPSGLFPSGFFLPRLYCLLYHLILMIIYYYLKSYNGSHYML